MDSLETTTIAAGLRADTRWIPCSELSTVDLDEPEL
jgi:hypothetical protein